MKIALYMTTILEYGGGLEKYLIETAANLAQYPNVTVDVITMDDRVTHRIVNGLSVFWMKKLDKNLSHKESLIDIRRRLGKAHYYKEPTIKSLRERLQQYDVIYSKNELIEGFVMRFLLRYRTLPPVVFGGHTPIFYPVANSFHSKLHNFLYGSFIYKFLAGGVHKFHALNEADASRYKKLFPKRSVQRIYNPFDIAAFRERAGTKQYELGKTDLNTIRILWLGRLSEQKGVQDLPQIIPAVNKAMNTKHVKLTWNIFGDGEERATVERLAKQYDNVQYYGHVDQQLAASVYAQHDIFLSTSKWEGYPYTLIEPQAFGLQLFAYDIPGPHDILQAYRGGHLARGPSDMIDLLTRELSQYRRPSGVPKAEPSKQFQPHLIYNQLLTFLGA